MFKIMLVLGTRPEAIKLAPVYRELHRRGDLFRTVCCATGQHRDLLDQVLALFSMQPDYDLNLLVENQDLFHVTTRGLEGIGRILGQERPDLVVVQGDTTSAFAGALAAFYLGIPVAHVEAGLRSHDKKRPFPEEMNRVFISRLADLHFCPTARAARNLLQEQVSPRSIYIVGNTVVDALLHIAGILDVDPPASVSALLADLPPGRLILATAHRRESFGLGMEHLSHALVDLTERYHDVTVAFSVHPNPNVREAVASILGGRDRILLLPAPDYVHFVALLKESYLVITDSGGIQEEAPSLRKPVLVARSVTERPEAIEAGTAILVGTDRDRIVHEAGRLLDDPALYASMIAAANPFGDGKSAVRIVDALERHLCGNASPTPRGS